MSTSVANLTKSPSQTFASGAASGTLGGLIVVASAPPFRAAPRA